MVKTPVLFITFARPEYARQTWDGIKAAQPKSLYFYSNKGRVEKDGEVERNNEIRSYINEIDWKCDLHTFFREECVNVYDSIRGAIDWLFANEECGIILEEDCVPTKAFFSYVDQLIDLYKGNKRIWCISGDNYLDRNPSDCDYFFSHYHWMYGWATWRDVWNMLDWNIYLSDYEKRHVYDSLFLTPFQKWYKKYETRLHRNYIEELGCWDYIFGLNCDLYKGLTIYPKEHLITNIGLSGIHHDSHKESVINKQASTKTTTYTINNHPSKILADKYFDFLTFITIECQHPLNRIIRYLKRKIKNIFKL